VPSADAAPSVAQTDPYFLYAGRLEHAKGPQTLIEPFRAWKHAKLVLAGTGSQETSLRQAAAGSDRIQFLGHLSSEALRPLYRNAVALIVPSLTYELFPLVILEAFNEGTPVIVRDHGSLPEPVLDSGGGLLYATPEELIARSGGLLSDRKLRNELGARGRDTVLTRWSPKAHMDRYLQVIDEAMERKREQSRAGVQFA
jgi:glycosyltransferase involved in cell wall biosynthesis